MSNEAPKTFFQNKPSLIWLGFVSGLLFLAAVSYLCDDPLKNYLPENTVLYLNRTARGTTKALAFSSDGTVWNLTRTKTGQITVASAAGSTPKAFRNPFPELSPWNKILSRLRGGYGYFALGAFKTATLLEPTDTPEWNFRGSKNALALFLTVPITKLPTDLVLWSTLGEPLPAMTTNQRTLKALAEGRVMINQQLEPLAIFRTATAIELLQKVSAQRQAVSKTLTLPDRSRARELIMNNNLSQPASLNSSLGTIIWFPSPNQVLTSAGILVIDNETSMLLNSVALSTAGAFRLENCPIKNLLTLTLKPFLAIGTDQSQRIVVCAAGS